MPRAVPAFNLMQTEQAMEGLVDQRLNSGCEAVVSHGQYKNGLRFGTQAGDEAQSRGGIEPMYHHAGHRNGCMRISAIVVAHFRLIVDGVST